MTESELSAEGDAQTPLPAPTDLEVVDVHGDEADVRFQDHADNKQGYRAYVGEDGYLSFDRSDRDYVEVPDSPSVSITGAISVVCKGSLGDFTHHQNVVAKGGDGAYRFRVEDDGRMWALIQSESSRSITRSQPVWSVGEKGVFGWTYDPTAPEVRFYKNGSQVDTGSVSQTSIADVADPLLVGEYTRTSPEAWDGRMDRLGVIAADIGDSGHANFDAGKVPSGDIRAWYGFNQGSGDTLTDYSGNGNHGTLQNNPTWVGGGDLTQNGGDISPQYGYELDKFGGGLKVPAPSTIADAMNAGNWSVVFSLAPQEQLQQDDWPDYFQFDIYSWRIEDNNPTYGREQVTRAALYVDEIVDSGPTQRLVGWIPHSSGQRYAGAFTVDAGDTGGTVKSYKNGSQVDEREHPGKDKQNTFGVSEFRVGAAQLKFAFGRFSIYNRTLSQNEVQAWSRGDAPPEGLIYDIRVNEGLGGIPQDNVTGDTATNNKGQYTEPVLPIRHTIDGLENGEAYVTRASVFTDHEEVFDR